MREVLTNHKRAVEIHFNEYMANLAHARVSYSIRIDLKMAAAAREGYTNEIQPWERD